MCEWSSFPFTYHLERARWHCEALHSMDCTGVEEEGKIVKIVNSVCEREKLWFGFLRSNTLNSSKHISRIRSEKLWLLSHQKHINFHIALPDSFLNLTVVHFVWAGMMLMFHLSRLWLKLRLGASRSLWSMRREKIWKKSEKILFSHAAQQKSEYEIWNMTTTMDVKRR